MGRMIPKVREWKVSAEGRIFHVLAPTGTLARLNVAHDLHMPSFLCAGWKVTIARKPLGIHVTTEVSK